MSRRGSSSRRCRSSRSCSTRSATLPARSYAVIIDEAHSSQTGEAAKDLRLALGAGEEQELTAAEAEDAGLLAAAIDPVEEALAKSVGARSGPAAEPVLLRVHRHARRAGRWRCSGGCNPTTAGYEPFHLYSMRQAIEEGFILDVLANYTTYQTFWRIEKATRGGPRVRRQEGPAGHRPVREPASPPPGAEGRDHRRALPQHTRQADGRAGEGDGGDLVPASRRPLQAEHRQVHQGQGLRRHHGPWSRSRASIDDGTGVPLTEAEHERVPREPGRPRSSPGPDYRC